MEGDLTTSDAVWSERDTSPGAIESALRELLRERHAEDEHYVPARVLNLVVVVHAEWSGEIANRLRGVGRFHASRTIVCAVEAKRETLDATASLASDREPGQHKDGEVTPVRELVVVRCGERHLAHLDTVVDPLVVSDVPTVLWAPHGHMAAVESLLRLSQVVLLDSIDEPDPADALDHAGRVAEDAYVVDLAWLRSTPWRERIAATFDPPKLRPDLHVISRFAVRHHPESAAAALLLAGWMASRLKWKPSKLMQHDGGIAGKASSRKQEVRIELQPEPEQSVRGLACVELETASGRWLKLERGDGGLHAEYRHTRGMEREWTVLGASRGEQGILGEGIRQALLRDPTYRPALDAACRMVT